MTLDPADAGIPATTGRGGVWARVGGPLLTLLAAAGLAAIADTPGRPGNPALVLLIPVVYSAYSGGLGPGLVSAAIGVAFAAYSLSPPGQPFRVAPDNLSRLLAVVIATPAITVMVGVLKWREQRRIAARAAGQAGERYRDLVNDLDGVVWEADAATVPLRFTFVSPAFEELTGATPAARHRPIWL